MDWLIYSSCIATIVSIWGLTRIAVKHHNKKTPKTLSELAVADAKLLQQFRLILLTCGSLFAITVLFYIAPNMDNGTLIALFGCLMVIGELAAALLPASGATNLVHLLSAYVMSVGMLGLAILFVVDHNNLFTLASLTLIAMIMAACLTVVNKKRYLIWELLFIYSSHISIVVAALATTILP